MNFVFLSPNFPPHYDLFCAALREAGIRVLGIGDCRETELGGTLRSSLDDYIQVLDMDDHEQMLRAVALFVHRHGRIDHIESFNEHWLMTEAQLREDFNVPGPRLADVQRHQSKADMAEVFARAGIDAPACERVSSLAQVRAFVAKHGFPVVLKPDVGVGAEGATVASDDASLQRLLELEAEPRVVQAFVDGVVTSYDGLTDRDGRIVFRVSFIYCDGVMEILRDQLDVYYYTRREIPPALEEMGRRMVEAYDIRGHFFHAEFFERPDGSFQALEMNFRPPGGFTTDLMNYACDVDVYRLFAHVAAGRDLSDFEYELAHHCAHVSRRERTYVCSHEQVLQELGSSLMNWRDIPWPISGAMGTPVYMVRHRDEAELLRLIGRVHERA